MKKINIYCQKKKLKNNKYVFHAIGITCFTYKITVMQDVGVLKKKRQIISLVK